MSWEDQGRQYHMWFGSGHAPPKLKTTAGRASAAAPDGLPARLTAVIHGALGALKRPARAQAEKQLRMGVLPLLTEAMASWAQGSRMDAPSFAHHFFHSDADDPVVTPLRDAATGAATATNQDELAAASGQLAKAMTAVGLDRWPRFVAHAVGRARDPVTLAAVTKSLQPVPTASDAKRKLGSASAGNGTRLAQVIEEPVPVEPEEPPVVGATPAPVSGGGGAVIGEPAATPQVKSSAAADESANPGTPAEAPRTGASPVFKSTIPTLTTTEILSPRGHWVGKVHPGADVLVRTVAPSEFADIEKQLLEGATPVSKSTYKNGIWYHRSDGSEFGVRNSTRNGITIDIDDPSFPPGFKVHQK